MLSKILKISKSSESGPSIESYVGEEKVLQSIEKRADCQGQKKSRIGRAVKVCGKYGLIAPRENSFAYFLLVFDFEVFMVEYWAITYIITNNISYSIRARKV